MNKGCTLAILITVLLSMPLITRAQTTNTFPATGNTGIGTTNPETILQLTGTSPLETVQDSSSSTKAYFGLTGSWFTFQNNRHPLTGATYNVNLAQAAMNLFAGNGDSFITFYTAPTNNTAVTERMRIDKVGNVGMGTTSPVFDANTARYLTIDAGSAGGGNSIGSFGAGGSVGPSAALGQYAFLNTGLGTTDKRVATIVGLTNGQANTGRIDFYATNAGSFGSPTMSINSNNVGIGTTSPTHKLVVGSGTTANVNSNLGVVNVGTDQAGFAAVSGGQRTAYLFSYSSGGLYGLNAYDYGSSAYLPVTINWGGTNTLLNTAGGRVGIGTPTPAEALDVVGNIKASGSINAKYQDVAEWVPSSEQLAAGTVVVLDSTKSNQVVASTNAYDTRVAGVISAQPGITLGEKSDDKVLVATTGRVRVMVDATKAPINIGDLLVTSDVPGVAMKSEVVNLGGVSIHRPGTIIGKALEPLAKGKGEILVLLSLQ